MRERLREPTDENIAETLKLAELGRNARIVFHDLSNHITAITLSIGHLEEKLAQDGERLREYTKRSERTRLQMEYVATLLRSHLKTAGKSFFKPAEEIKTVVENFFEKARLNGIKIIVDIDKKIEIFGEKRDFGHIVTNLISNALESFETVIAERERRIRIKLRGDKTCICCSVADTGCGISDANIQKIFSPGFTTKRRGHGIGLCAAKECVEKTFGGNISLTSSSAGTEFLVKIPSMTERETQNEKRQTFPVLLCKTKTQTNENTPH